MSTLPTVVRLARKLEKAKQALRVIRTWAAFRGGVALDPKHVKKLCDKTLKEIKEKS